MSRDFNSLYDFMDLTQDEENSNDSIIASEVHDHPNKSFKRLPPPLIPIPKDSVPVTTINKKIPKLTRIFNSNASPICSQPSKLVNLINGRGIYKINIPHNVVIQHGKGPVFMNVPGIGSLQLKLDPEIKNQVDQLAPNLHPIPVVHSDRQFIVKKESSNPNCFISTTPKSQLIKHTKSNHTSVRKNSDVKHIIGFTRHTKIHNSSLRKSREDKPIIGFTKHDCSISIKCLFKLRNVIDHYTTKLQREKRHFQKLNKSDLSKNNNIRPDNFDDLLVTKKIIILDSERNRHVSSDIKLQSILSLVSTTSKPIQIENWHRASTDPLTVRYLEIPYRSKSRKKYLFQNNFTLNQYKEDVKGHIISTKREFRKHIQFIKPVLFINSYNYFSLNVKDMFPKTNIIYIYKPQTFFNEDLEWTFFYDVITGYIKVIHSEILKEFIREDLRL